MSDIRVGSVVKVKPGARYSLPEGTVGIVVSMGDPIKPDCQHTCTMGVVSGNWAAPLIADVGDLEVIQQLWTRESR